MDVTIKRVEFVVEDEVTFCSVFYTAGGNLGGWKHTKFPGHISIVTFLDKEISNFMLWPDGRHTPVVDEIEDL